MNEDYNINLTRLVAGELFFLLGMTAAREMYGKSYFSLGIGEKNAVDQAVRGAVQANCQAMTPDFVRQVTVPPMPVAAPQKPAVGFQPSNPIPKSEA